ncbi:MAG: hypothetical protein ABW046_18845 [Actinoplanes sp.]
MVGVRSRIIAGFAGLIRIRDRQFDPARFAAAPSDPRPVPEAAAARSMIAEVLRN